MEPLIHGPGWRPDVIARLGMNEPRERLLTEFCQRWCVTDLALFGSVLRPDFRPDSDVDVLVSFHQDADWGLIEHAAMEEALAGILERPVDLLTRRAVERSTNLRRRTSIMTDAIALVRTTHLGRARYDLPRARLRSAMALTDPTSRLGNQRRHAPVALGWRPDDAG